MLFNFEPYEVYNIKDMQAYCADHDLKLLSDFTPDRLTGDWWDEYKDNYKKFDLQFRNKYASLIPMFQEDHEDLAALVTAWRKDVEAFLLANDKRYLELWRVNTIPDNDAYSLVNNVDYTETTERDITFDKGQQQNIIDGETNYGQQVVDDDKSLQYNTTDTQGSTTTNSTSAYNDSGYTPTDKSETSVNGYTDIEDNSMTYGAHKDERDDIYTDGERRDITDENVTIHKVGNMGIQTVNDNLMKHQNLWEGFDFYGFIMEEIAKNLLRGC